MTAADAGPAARSQSEPWLQRLSRFAIKRTAARCWEVLRRSLRDTSALLCVLLPCGGLARRTTGLTEDAIAGRQLCGFRIKRAHEVDMYQQPTRESAVHCFP